MGKSLIIFSGFDVKCCVAIIGSTCVTNVTFAD